MTAPVEMFLETVGEPPAAREADFLKLAQLTALRRSASGEYYISNVRRGHLLYSLVYTLRPDTVLEIGTGRGYGALCMAMAAADAGINTKIITVDQIPPDTKQDWHIDEGNGPNTLRKSLKDVWAVLPGDWTRKIETRTGQSTTVMRDWLSDPQGPRVDFAFIDGGHDFWTVRHDIMSAVFAGRGRSVSLLLDDYGGVQGEAIRRIVDRNLTPSLPENSVHRLEMPQTKEEFADNGEHGMVFIDGRVANVTAERFGWGAPGMSALLARMAANVERGVWATKAAVAPTLRRLGVRR